MRVCQFSIVITTPRYAEAAAQLSHAGNCAVVERGGVHRQLVIRCPDGCGEVLSINLDPRTGPAWRLHHRRGHWSLFPSIDKPSGCLSHFILWRGNIFWCDGEGDNGTPELYTEIVQKLPDTLQGRGQVGFVQLADELGEVPWDVLAACRHLVRTEVLEEQPGKVRGIFSAKRSNVELAATLSEPYAE